MNRNLLWLCLGLTALLVACGGPGAPSVKLTATPTSLEDGQVVTLKAEVNGTGKMVVEFFKSNEKVGVDDTAPYETSMPLTSNDDVTLAFSAKATAADAQFGLSNAVNVNVKVDKIPPTVKLTSSSPKLSAAGSVTLTANATDNKGVVKVEFYKGITKLGESTTPINDIYSLNLELNAADNGTQTYTAKAYDKKGNVGSAEISVDVDIDNTPPTISLSSDKATVSSPGSATLTANASDNKGVVKVEFYQVQSTGGDIKLREDTQAPFTFDLAYTDANNGTHTYKANAYDGKGNLAESNSVSIAVDIDVTPPTISLSSNKTSLTSAGSVLLSANALDNKGVVKVEFYEGPTLLSTKTTAPFTHSISYTHQQNGVHHYSARAFDARNNSASSNPTEGLDLLVNVEIDASKPAVSLSADKASLSSPGSVILSADATDDKGITKVEFYLVQSTGGSLKLGQDSQAPFTHTLNFPRSEGNNGIHSYSARAFDANDNSADSDPLSLEVSIDASNPSVFLSADKTSLSAVGSFTLTAQGSDNSGISKIEFYKNGLKIGEDTDPVGGYTWQVDYQQSYLGTDIFTAKATDLSSNFATSTPVYMQVDIDISKPVVGLSSDVQTLAQPGDVTLTAQSSDNRAVTKVEIYRVTTGGDEPLKSVDNPTGDVQHKLAIKPDDNGIVKFYAKAYDAKGNTATTPETQVEVAIKPSINSFYQVSTQSTAINLTDAGGTVDLEWSGDNVQSYSLNVDGNATASVNAGNTATITLPGNATGTDKTYTVTLTAKSYGTPPLADDTKTLTITVAKDTTLPTISLSKNPTTTITTAGSVTLTAAVSDAAGIEKVEFFKSGDTNPIHTDSDATGGYTHTINYTADGTHSYTATATDKNGNAKTSDAVSVTVSIQSSGSLDTTFDTDGKITTPVFGQYDAARAIAIQGDGKILVAGRTFKAPTPWYDFGLIRYNSDGTLDTSFDSDGKVNTDPFGNNNGDDANAMAIQSDGKIVVVGYGQNQSYDFAVVRYNSNGSLDTSFDTDGTVRTNFGGSNWTWDMARAVAIQSDGKIVVAGISGTNPNFDFALVRYNTNGSLDTSFDTDGKLTTAIGSGNDEANALLLQSDGKIVVAGFSYNGSNNDFALVRYNTDGSLDTTFDTDGKVTTAIGTDHDAAYAIALQSDNKIVAVGDSKGTAKDFAAVRYNSDGSLDTGFDSDGKMTVSNSSLDDTAYAVAIQANGKIVLAGYNLGSFGLVRLNSDGSLDTSFDTDGKISTPFPGAAGAYAVAIQSDGKIVAAGYSGNEFALARYKP